MAEQKEPKRFVARVRKWMTIVIIFLCFEVVLHLIDPVMDIESTPSPIQASLQDGVLYVHTFVLRNGAYIPLKDPQLLCEVQGNSGTVITSMRKTIYEIIPAENSRTFGPFVLGKTNDDQAANLSCRVRTVNVEWSW